MFKNAIRKSIALMITSVLVLSPMIQQNGYAETSNSLTVEQEKTLVFGSFSDPINLNPLLAIDNASSEINELLFRRLVKLNEKMEFTPDLLTQMPQMSADGLSYTLTLHPSLKWQDGKAMTAEDVKFSFDFVKNSNNLSPKIGYIEAVRSVEVLDPQTIKMNMRMFDPEFLNSLSNISVIPKHIWENVLPNSLLKSDYNKKNPVGCGPYILKEYSLAESIVLVKNPNYSHGPTYSFDKVIYKIYPSLAVAVAKLETGEVDAVSILETSYEKVKNNPMLNLYTYDKSTFEGMLYNFNHPILSNKKVRQAIASMINKEDVLKTSYYGLGSIAHSTWYMNSPFYNPNIKKWEYNKGIAMQLLDDAGWKVGANGIREKNGQPLQFSLITNKGNLSRERNCEFIAKSLSEIGIVVDVKVYDWNTFMSEYIYPGKFDAYLSGFGTRLSADQSDFYSSEMGKGIFNRGKYKNDEVDALLNQASKTIDPIERKSLYDRVQMIVTEEQAICTFVFKKGFLATSKSLKNVKVYPMMGYYEFKDWYKGNPNEQPIEVKTPTPPTTIPETNVSKVITNEVAAKTSTTKPIITDLHAAEWARLSVETLVEKGILTLDANNSFEPNVVVTRGQYIDMLIKSLKLSATFTESFTDVAKTSPYYTSIGIAKKLDLTKELGLKQIKPDSKITREECMVITSKALSISKKMKISGSVKDISKFKDYKSVSPSAIPSIHTMINKGYFTTKNQLIQPKGTLTKAEAAALMYKLYLL